MFQMTYFNHYYRDNRPIYVNPYPFIYVPISELKKVGAKVTWDEKQMAYRVTSDYHQLKTQNQQLRQRLSEFERLATNQNLRADDQNWEMHLGDQANTKYS